MTVKQVAALIVAGLVAGVVLGSFGIAGAGDRVAPPAMSAAECSTGDCAEATPAEMPAECGGGACADCQ